MDASKFKTHENILSVFATMRYIVYIASFVDLYFTVLFDYFIDVCSRCVICPVFTARRHA